MSNIHNNGNNRSDLEELGKSYAQLQQEEPPDLLDRAVLNRAHRAVEEKPHWMRFGWLHGLTTAAVFVLAFSLVLNQREPVPDFETGIQGNELQRAHPKELLGTQSAEQPADSLLLQEKEKKLIRQDSAKRMRIAVPTSPAPEPESRAKEELQPAESEKSNIALEYRASESVRFDEDAMEASQKLDEKMSDDIDLLADQLEPGAVAAAPVVAQPTAAGVGETEAKAKQHPEIEKKIQAIIELRQSGDPNWQTELAAFRKTYPAYPIPDELKN